MSVWNKRQRMESIINGGLVDRPPVLISISVYT